MKTKAEIVAHSVDPRGNELISFEVTFPRIILAEVLTHRMFSRNTSSSRAIPFKKMLEAVKEHPFIPIAWQKNHKGMQGTEYFMTKKDININIQMWLRGRDEAIKVSKLMNSGGYGITKQLCNRLLEPFMWTTMLITTSREGLENFFTLRCPRYFDTFRSWKEASNLSGTTFETSFELRDNSSQAEIHIQQLAELMYDVHKESEPDKLKEGDWHIPYKDRVFKLRPTKTSEIFSPNENFYIPESVKVSTSMAARVSYTVFEGKEVTWNKHLVLYDKLNSYDPPHSSPFEHCAKVMSNEEYKTFIKGKCEVNPISEEVASSVLNEGWCNNFRGFMPLRYMVDNDLI